MIAPGSADSNGWTAAVVAPVPEFLFVPMFKIVLGRPRPESTEDQGYKDRRVICSLIRRDIRLEIETPRPKQQTHVTVRRRRARWSDSTSMAYWIDSKAGRPV